jgi:hypothetical protein
VPLVDGTAFNLRSIREPDFGTGYRVAGSNKQGDAAHDFLKRFLTISHY